jgi:putative SOS response-associated peptidase YedK
MCGRFTLRTSMKDLRDFLPFLEIPDLPPRYNICPTQEVAAVLTEPG